MQQKSTAKLVVCIVGTVVFALLGIRSFVSLVQDLGFLIEGYGGVSFLLRDLVGVLGYLVLAAGTLVLGLDKADKKLEILAFAGACAAALSQFISLIMGFSYGNYLVWNSYLYEEKFNFLCFLPSFFEFLAYAAFALALAFGLLKALSAKKALFKNLWFVPAAVLLFARIIFVICYAIYDYDWYGAYGMSFFGVVWTVFELVGMCTGGILVLNPGILPASAQQASAQQAYAQPDGSYAAPGGYAQPGAQTYGTQAEAQARQYYAQPQKPDGYCDMLKHVLLLLFTFGIWQFIWIYRTTEFLNRTPNESPRSGVSQLLLCMFVPFYIIYWVYASCKRIDKLAYYNGIQGEITVMCVLFEIFIAILAPIFMQDKLNNIVTFRNIPPAGVDPAYQQAQQAAWQQQAQAQTYQAQPQAQTCQAQPQAQTYQPQPQPQPQTQTQPQAAPQQPPVYQQTAEPVVTPVQQTAEPVVTPIEPAEDEN